MYPLELNPLDRSKVVGKCLKWVKIVRRKMTAKIRSFFSPYIPLYQLHVPTPSMAGFSCHFGANWIDAVIIGSFVVKTDGAGMICSMLCPLLDQVK
jgi:hypothetical protein